MRNAILLLLIILHQCIAAYGQDIKTIKLKSKKQLYTPENYAIDNVIDDRKDTTNIGEMHAGITGKSKTVNLENGAAKAINFLIQENIPVNDELPKVQLHLTQLEVSEKNTGIREQAEVTFGVAFYDKQNKLAEYNGSANVQTGLDASAYIAQLVINNLERCLKGFDDQMKNTSKEKGVSTEIFMETTSDNKDEIYYSTKSKLNFDDFTGEVDDLSIGSALTYSGIGMKYSHQRLGNSVKLKITLFCYFNKSKSWYKKGIANEKTLKHEQLHFDITAYNTCRLFNKIKNYSFSVENYIKELDTLLREADKECSAEQNQYDKESNHGIKEAQQSKWVTDVNGRLSSNYCY